MRPIPPVVVDTPHTNVAYVNVATVLDNCLNVIFVGNKRPFYTAELSESDGSGRSDTILSTTRAIAQLLDTAAQPSAAWLIRPDYEEMGPGLVESNLSQATKDWLRMLTSRPALHTDMGRRLKELVIGARGDRASISYAATPTTGYCREYVETGLELPNCGFGLRLPAVSSDWNMGIAKVLMALDLARFAPQLIPDLAASQVAGHDYKSRPIGQMLAYIEQLNELMDLPLLYLLQGSLFAVHAYQDFNGLRAELAAARDPRTASALSVRHSAESALSSLPLHPLLGYVSSIFKRGAAHTYFGSGAPLYLLASSTARTESEDGHVHMITRASLAPQLRNGSTVEALDFAFAREVVRDQTSAAERHEVWGQPAHDVPVNKQYPDTVSYGELLRQVTSLGDATVKRISGMGRKLGWGSIVASSITMRQDAASVMFTDGRAYSEDPSAALAGLKPCVAVSNVRFSGHIRRFDDAWNAKVTVSTEKERTSWIRWNVLVVDGFQNPIDGADVYMRTYMPAGMLMGEPDVTPMLAPAVEANPVLSAVVDAYRRRSKQYVRSGYRAPTGVHPKFWTTDWDGFSENADPDLTNTALAAGYAGQLEPIETTTFVFHERFYHRVAVKMSLLSVGIEEQAGLNVRLYPAQGTGPTLYECFDGAGRLFATLKQDGAVAFTDPISLGSSTAPLEALVQMQPVGQKIAFDVGEQISVEEPLAQ